MSREYVAFISYRHTPLDMKVAKALHSIIEQYRVPKSFRKNGEQRLGLVFRDQEELPVSSDLSGDICKALDHAEFLIVVCTPNTPQSIWVEREINYFLQRHDRSRVLAVLAEGEPSESFPPALTFEIDPVTGNKRDVEPLAADIRGMSSRETVSNLRKEAPRLFAAMLGCPYDALVMREQRRRRKRIFAGVTAAFAVAAAFTAVTTIKNVQLQDKNEELAAQKADILLRESELLTINAQTALEEDNMVEAIRQSRLALTTEDGSERPYYGPAERTLFQSLDLFGESTTKTVLVNTDLTQETPIRAYAFSPSGAKAITVDSYGSVIMYDAVSGEALWSKQLDNIGFSERSVPVFLAKQKLVIVHGTYDILAFHIDSGELVWTHDMGTYDNVATSVVASPDQTRFLYVRQESSPDDGFQTSTSYLVESSTENGQTLNKYVFPVKGGSLASNYEDYSGQHYPHGVFSNDGTLFAGSYFHKQDGTEDVYCQSFYILNFKTKAIKTVYQIKDLDILGETFPFLIDIRTDKHTVAYAYTPPFVPFDIEESEQPNAVFQYAVVDYTTGETIHDNDIFAPEENTSSYYSDFIGGMVHRDLAIIYADNVVYSLRRDTGDVLGTHNAASAILSMDVNSPDMPIGTYFTTINKDGIFELTWTNGERFTEIISAETVPCLSGKSVHGGLCRVDKQAASHSDSTYVFGSESEGLGYYALIPAEDDHTVSLYRCVAYDNAQVTGSIDQPESHYYSHTYISNNDLFAIHEQDGEKDVLKIFDATNYQQIQTLPFTKPLSPSDAFVLPDATGYIYCSQYGDIILYDQEGNETVLLSNENVNLEIIANTQMVASGYSNSSAIQRDTNDVITASTDNKQLSLWKNGKPLKTVSLEEQVNVYYQTAGSFNRLLQVGKNGYVLMSHYGNAQEKTLTHFACYHIETDEFLFIKDVAGGSPTRICALGESEAVFGVVDTDNHLRLYNIPDGTLSNDISLPVPYSSIKNVYWICNDTAVAVVTQDDQLLIFNAQTAEVLYRYTSPLSFIYTTEFYYNENDSRLIIVSDDSAMILETNDWTTLYTIESEVVGYNPQTESLGIEDFTDNQYVFYHLPSTDELLELAAKYKE